MVMTMAMKMDPIMNWNAANSVGVKRVGTSFGQARRERRRRNSRHSSCHQSLVSTSQCAALQARYSDFFPINVTLLQSLFLVHIFLSRAPLICASLVAGSHSASGSGSGSGSYFVATGADVSGGAGRRDMEETTTTTTATTGGGGMAVKNGRVFFPVRHNLVESRSGATGLVGRRLDQGSPFLTPGRSFGGMLSEPEPANLPSDSASTISAPPPSSPTIEPRISTVLNPLPYANSFYTVDIQIGYPPQVRTLVVDTTESFTWTFCKYENFGLQRLPNAPHLPFDVGASRTAMGMTCQEENCTSLLSQTSVQVCYNETCGFQILLEDNAADSTAGIVMREQVGLVPDVVYNFGPIGCGVRTTGNFLNFSADGVLGLSRSPISLLSILAMSGLPNIMSLCLNSSASSGGGLVFGTPPPVVTRTSPSTPLFGSTGSNSSSSVFIIQMVGRRIGQYESSVSCTTVISSVNYFTYVPGLDFNHILNEISLSINALPSTELTSYHQLACYLQASVTCNLMPFPTISFGFLDGAVLDIYPQDYLLTYSNGSACVLCLGIRPSEHNITTLGSTAIQRTWVIHDLERNRMSFVKGSCDGCDS